MWIHIKIPILILQSKNMTQFLNINNVLQFKNKSFINQLELFIQAVYQLRKMFLNVIVYQTSLRYVRYFRKDRRKL